MTARVLHYGEVRGAGGFEIVKLRDQASVDSFRADPEGFYARAHNATVEQYHLWVETEGVPRCAGFTAKRRRCRNGVSGRFHRSFDKWLSEDLIEFCAVHGGPKSVKRR